MILINVKWTVKPEYAEQFPSLVKEFTDAVRQEPGNIFFEWSRSVDDPNQFVLIEAFQDDAAAAHVNSDHFKTFVNWAPDAIDVTPQIISVQNVPGSGWSEMAEVKPR